MASTEQSYFEKRLFKVAKELNVSTDRVVEFLEEQGYGDSLHGTGFNGSIVSQEAYLVLRDEFADDAEAAEKIRELRSEDEGEVATLEEEDEIDDSDGSQEKEKSDKQTVTSKDGTPSQHPSVLKISEDFEYSKGKRASLPVFEWSTDRIVESGESQHVELKSTCKHDIENGGKSRDVIFSIAKVISSFLNSDGGVLVVGVSDNFEATGFMEVDNFDSKDEAKLQIASTVEDYLNARASRYLDIFFDTFEGKKVMKIKCTPSDQPIFIKGNDGTKECYFREFNRSRPLKIDEFYDLVYDRFSK
jgi:hypothetical protein